VADTPASNPLDDITALADEIGASGAAEDGAVGQLSKAVATMSTAISDALRDAVGVLKLQKGEAATAHLEEPRGGEADSDPDGDGTSEDSDADVEEEDGAGYEDMAMGDGYLDVTEFVQGIAKDNAQLRKAVAAQSKQIAELKALTSKVLETQVRTVGPLAKGVIELHERLAQVPEVPMSLGGNLSMPRARRRHGIEPPPSPEASGGYIGGSHAAELQQLAKAQSKRVITDDQLRWFNRTRTFASDESTNKQLRDTVAAL
jgi:hypothetical protein